MDVIVVDVLVGGTSWNIAPHSLVQNDPAIPLPWDNLNQIQIQFSKNVDVVAESLSLLGINVADYSPDLQGFEYLSASRMATWTFSSDFDTDRLLINLAGQLADPAPVQDPLGNSLNGGSDFNLPFGVLPGDVDGSGVVLGDDLAAVIDDIAAASHQARTDLDGSGVVDGDDESIVQSRQFQFLPSDQPTEPTGSLSNAELIDHAMADDDSDEATFDSLGESDGPFVA